MIVAARTPPTTLVNIISVSYSGSTWLNLLLGAMPGAFSVGELSNIRQHGRAICRLHGDACPIWPRFNAAADRAVVDRIGSITRADTLVLNNPRQYQATLDASGRRQKFIHLIRDGRAVAASILRKFPDRSMFHAARHWVKSVRKNESLLRHRPNCDVLVVRYEDALGDPESAARRVCDFAGMAFDPAAIAKADEPRCFLGGSRGMLHTLARKVNPSAPTLHACKYDASHLDRAFYESAASGPFRDERWVDELTVRQLQVFRLVAGRTNARFGYSPALSHHTPIAPARSSKGLATAR